jgi:hypothetical protein
MASRLTLSFAALGAAGVLLAGPAFAQRPGAPAAPATPPTPEAIAMSQAELAKPRTMSGYVAPRLAIGQPDLQGMWTNASLTSLTRGSEFNKLVLSDDEAKEAVEKNPLTVRQKTDDQGSADALTKSDGKDLNSGRGYNAFWVSPGDGFGNVKGSWRTSWIVDPPSGQIPMSADGRKLQASMAKGAPRGGFANPEERGLGERCIISFAGHAGPIMNNSRYYNDNFQIVQSPDAVMILLEMNHDARIIPLGKDRNDRKHRPAVMAPYMGDSIGWWEGDTLVVETINFNPSQIAASRVPLTPAGKLTERFTRYSDDQVLYEFEVEDPALYTQVWKGEMPLNKSEGLYEYACHEGNYAMHGILAGARVNEARGLSPGGEGDSE